MKDKRNISIARKLIIYFVFSSLIIASIGTSVSLYRDYQAHKKRVQDKFKQIKLISKNNNTDGKYHCPISAGVSFLDQIKMLEKLNSIEFSKIAYPLLFLPFLGFSF